MGEDDDIEDWKRVWSAIEARLLKIPKSKSDFYRDSLVSPRIFANMRRYGAPISAVQKRVAICRAVGWTDDSVDRILTGDDALVIEDQLDREMQIMSAARLTLEREPSPENEQRFIESRDRVNDLRERLGRTRIDHRAVPAATGSPANERDMLNRLETLEGRVMELERAVRDLQRARQPGDAFTPDRGQ
ncbi:MAG TPA: hypothetical protein VFV63_00985 [Ilumatobacteraceae bacterium]|nr:hypothetical protein [Ilumatobacteraceae bacterium]